MTRPRITIVTDGACSGNGTARARGGWAAILVGPDGRTKELSGAEAPTTNNRMELRGVIEGLRALKAGWPGEIQTDSAYVADAITKGWMAGWKRRGWKKSSGEQIKNEDLWMLLDEQLTAHPDLVITWVRGHNGHPMNERADRLAVEAAAHGPR
ncbi:ribonuclease H family protein [Miltoncostaea oceani]|uniref:ribonuclease H family protein n=1 Tax=Miltoncostaea oceani TaxID=2843216 RepID=UPI001FE8FD5A|nr:ribonuclease H [Miltoncostaea oceani]